jgi:hypothetical protein
MNGSRSKPESTRPSVNGHGPILNVWVAGALSGILEYEDPSHGGALSDGRVYPACDSYPRSKSGRNLGIASRILHTHRSVNALQTVSGSNRVSITSRLTANLLAVYTFLPSERSMLDVRDARIRTHKSGTPAGSVRRHPIGARTPTMIPRIGYWHSDLGTQMSS